MENVLFFTLTTDDLKKKFPLIVAYGKYMGSTDWYVETQLWKAYYNGCGKETVSFNQDKPKLITDYTESQQAGIKYYL